MEEFKCSNTHPCTCANEKCERHGRCCECIAAHLGHDSFPHCVKDLMAKKAQEQQ